YTEHLVFALHLHAFWFMLGTLVMVGLTWFEPLVWMAVLVIPVYAALAFRRVYGGSAWRLAWRAVLLMLAHLTLVVLLVALTALVALLL
ncbi:MAG: hypothetical protein Q8R98_06095, partial [Rubrivivax sp.]|nr:hypothetical protein [Rubrivivax sp.]